MKISIQFILVIILLPIFMIQCARSPVAPTIESVQSKKSVPIIDHGMSIDRLSRLDQFLDGEIASKKIPGAVVLINRKGQTVYEKSYGFTNLNTEKPMTQDEIFYIQSMTKPIVTVAFMMLYESGHFQLNDPVSKYLPQFTGMRVAKSQMKKEGAEAIVDTAANKAITIKHLLSHTAGFSHGLGQTELEKMYFTGLYGTEHKTIEDRANALASLPLIGQPGEQWYYSASPDILALLIEKFSGMSCAAFLEQNIFGPLKMEDTGYNVDAGKEGRIAGLHLKRGDAPLMYHKDQTKPTGHTVFGGTHGLFSTASDYMEFALMLLDGGKRNNIQFLSPKTIELMTQNHIGDVPYDSGHSFGLGFGVKTDVADSATLGSVGTYYWSGAYNTYFFIDPEEELVAIMMTQFWPYTNYYADKLSLFVNQAIID